MKKYLFSCLMIFIMFTFVLTTNDVWAAMSSANYRIDWDSISVGGDNTSSSASYNLRDSVGNTGAGIGTSTSYRDEAGYRAGVYDRTADFDIFVQSVPTQVAATNFSGVTITVSDASAFTVGDMFALIQDEGVSQVAAIGKITNIIGNVIYFDSLKHAGVAPVIDGANDYFYKLALTGGAISFGILNSSAVSTGIIAWEVSAEVDDGYGVYVYENQDLQISPVSKISDVVDGAVSVGGNEYGGRSSDTTLSGSTFDTADTAFTSTLQQIGSKGMTSFSSRDFITIKVGVASGATAGTYSQTLNVIYVGDY